MCLLAAGLSVANDRIDLRPQNPFIQVHGQPAYLSADLLGPGEWRLQTNVAVASHADMGVEPQEQIFLDGETLLLEVRGTWSVGEQWQLHLTLPYYQYSGGFMDAPIEQFHKLIGASNDERDGPRGRMRVEHRADGVEPVSVDGSGGGLGDVRAGAAYRLWQSESAADVVSLHAGVKFTTGDADDLTGSEATDVYAALAWRRAGLFGRASLSADGHVGVLRLGDGEVLDELQEDTVFFAGFGLAWRWNDTVSLLTQVSASTGYYDSYLAELDSNVVQLGLGLNVSPPRAAWSANVAVIEDIWSDATTDFALQFELSMRLYGQPD